MHIKFDQHWLFKICFYFGCYTPQISFWMRHSNNCLINRGTPICHLPKNAPLWSIHQGMVGKTFSADMNSPLLDPFLTFGVEVTGPGTKWMQTSYSTTYMQSMTVTFTIKTVRNNKHIPVFFSSFCYYSLLRVEQFGPFSVSLHNNNETMLFYLDTTNSAYMYAIIAVRQCLITGFPQNTDPICNQWENEN